MKILSILACLFMSMDLIAQEIVELPFETNADVKWPTAEKEYYSDLRETQVVTNVSVPRLKLYKADNPNGTNVIVAPGGGLYTAVWLTNGKNVGMYMYSRNRHCFGMKKQNLASDNWINQFQNWALTERLTKPTVNQLHAI